MIESARQVALHKPEHVNERICRMQKINPSIFHDFLFTEYKKKIQCELFTVLKVLSMFLCHFSVSTSVDRYFDDKL